MTDDLFIVALVQAATALPFSFCTARRRHSGSCQQEKDAFGHQYYYGGGCRHISYTSLLKPNDPLPSIAIYLLNRQLRSIHRTTQAGNKPLTCA